ncbi:hypothetical protein CVS40_0909 [Lucilia cuprina]|nr:hypothetical protein CVS40_0909 [Lucilia cuprina]
MTNDQFISFAVGFTVEMSNSFLRQRWMKLSVMVRKNKLNAEKIVALLTERSQDNDSTQNLQVNQNVSNLPQNETIFQDNTVNNQIGQRSNELKINLAKWAIFFNISNIAVNNHLYILKDHVDDLPSDSRSLKHTPIASVVEKMVQGTPQNLELNINIDGLPLSKSSNSQIWPILVNIHGYKDVCVVAAFCGYRKPPTSDMLMQKYSKEIELNGVRFQGITYQVKCRAFICDAPARAFLIGIKGHTGYHSCPKCTQKGSYVNHKMIYKLEDHRLRTDEDFRLRVDPNHHNCMENLEIEKLDIDMVKNFPNDYMHVVCLGVTKTMLLNWIKKRNTNYCMNTNKIKSLESRLLFLKNQIPKEFSRKPRPFNELERILLDKQLCLTNRNCGYNMLKEFLNQIPTFFDESLLTFNFHCLLHLCDDVENYGDLGSFSAFPFENYLQQLKLRTAKNLPITANQNWKK